MYSPPSSPLPSTIQPFLFFRRLTCCSQNTSRNFWDGVPAVVLVYSHLPLIPANPVPLRWPGIRPRAYETLGRKKRSAVDDFGSASWGPGLRRPELCLLAVTRGFVPPRFCLSPLCPQRLGSRGLCWSAAGDCSRKRGTHYGRTDEASRQFKAILGVRRRLQYRRLVRARNLNAPNNGCCEPLSHQRHQASLRIPLSLDVPKMHCPNNPLRIY